MPARDTAARPTCFTLPLGKVLPRSGPPYTVVRVLAPREERGTVRGEIDWSDGSSQGIALSPDCAFNQDAVASVELETVRSMLARGTRPT